MELEEDTYSSIFNALKHPIRRRILRIIENKPTTYTEIQNQLNIDNGLLNYHLENMRSLLTKTENGNYTLSEFGGGATRLLEKVEQPSSNQDNNLFGINPLYIKYIIVMLIICLGALSFQYIKLDNRYNILETQNVALEMELAEDQKNLEQEIVYETLKMALIEEMIPTHKTLTHNTNSIILSTELIEDVTVPSRVGSYKIILMSPEKIEAKADAEGDFHYLVFTRFDLNPRNIMIYIETAGVFNSVGGMSIQFRLTGTVYSIWIS
jgi:DNA-binding transcriptional ArsR family regulator